jgi:transposase
MFGVPLPSPAEVFSRMSTDLAAIERLVRTAPAQIERILGLGEEVVGIGYRVLEITERLDARAESIGRLGERLDARAAELIALGEHMQQMGGQIDDRGAEIVAGAERVSDTAHELLLVLPTLERALELATPLEGAIDRFGRFVDRFPGASPARRRQLREGDPSGEEPA